MEEITQRKTFQPLHEKVAIRPDAAIDKTESGIFLAEASRIKKFKGTVVAVGIGYLLVDGKVRPLDVKVGDRVAYSQYGGTEIDTTVDPEIGVESLLLIDERQIFGILPEGE